MTSTKISIYFKINLIITALLSLLFLIFQEGYTTFSFIFTLFALISTSATLYLIYYILFRAFFRFSNGIKYILAFLFTLTNILLLTDWIIYRSWGYHINGMVLNIMLSPSAYDSLIISTSSVVFVTLTIVGLFGLQFVLLKKIATISEKKEQSINSKFNKYLSISLLFIIISEKLTYSVANLHANTEILNKSSVVPLYQPLLMDDLLISLGMKKVKSNNVALNLKTVSNIKYPLHKIEIKNSKKPNIFIFGIDALRPDVLTPAIAPNINAFEDHAIDFEDNYSGGNNTRFGLFSFFYGINSSYWFGFLNIGKGPVIFDTLKDLHYQISIISSANMSWPEFRKTAFYNVQDKIKDNFKGSILTKDKKVIKYFSQWIEKQNPKKSIFSFLWLDGVHASVYPNAHRKFLPDNDKVNDYLSATKSKKTALFNMYKNSVNTADARFKEFIDILKKKGLYNNSIIIVMSDHGQEFYEHGYYGHNSAYDTQQARCTFIFKDQNETKPEVVHHMTSHLDVVPTLMKRLGVTNPSSDYSHGENLFDKNYKRACSFVGNWNENAIICKDNTFIISDIVTKAFDNQIRDTKSYKPVKLKDKSELNRVLMESLKQNSQFSH